MIEKLDTIRIEASNLLDQNRRSELGQFMTPANIAQFMASLFSKTNKTISLLEAGAGIGSLIVAFLEEIIQKEKSKLSISVTAYEIDPKLARYLSDNLKVYKRKFAAAGIELDSKIITDDFILSTPHKTSKNFTHAILNPPYKKINSLSDHRLSLRQVGQEHVNLYSAFVGLSLSLLQKNGELVAIIPRSFCNGVYYKPFREYILKHSSVKRIHLFESRTQAFKDDEVLQENIIILLEKGAKQGPVTISTSYDTNFKDARESEVPFSSIIKQDDSELFIHIPDITEIFSINDRICFSLDDLDLQVSTGPVVDFRFKDYLRTNPIKGSMPLLYATHFNGNSIQWPKVSKKPNALMINSETTKSSIPNGYYTVVKRFSSKEEKQRIVARVIDPNLFDTKIIGLENHLNYFHCKKKGMDKNLAYGLAAYLNTTYVDKIFRTFNGHTQVNATDLRQLKYPSRETLIAIGTWAQKIENFIPEYLDVKVMKAI